MRNQRVKALHARWHTACRNANNFLNITQELAINEIAFVRT
jgi:hypothetical protein